MDILYAILSAVAGYLIGSFSSTRLVARLVAPKTALDQMEIKAESGEMIRPSGVSATTISAALGWKAGCSSSLLDMLKVFAPTMALKLLFPGQPYFLIYAFFGVVGNNWPLYYGFKGGWGISAIYGGIFAVDPLGTLVAMAGSFLIGLLLRDWIVLFLTSLWLLVPWLWFRTHDPAYLIYIVGVNLLMMMALLPEMKQYIQARKMARLEGGSLADQVPMGRGLLKMMKMMGMDRK